MRKTVLAIVTAALVLIASDARADIVVFKNGRTMSVKSCAVGPENAVMLLRTGGEVTFPASIIARVDPDEVPYPDTEANETPETVADATVVAPAVAAMPFAFAAVPDEVLAARPF